MTYLPDDHRHQLKFQVVYSSLGLNLGWNPLHLSGAPLIRLYLTPIDSIGRYPWQGVDPGSDPNDGRKWTELGSRNYFNLDLRTQYDLHGLIGLGQRLSLITDSQQFLES